MADTLLQPDDQIQIDDSKNYWEELTAPGGKFDRTKYASEDELKAAIGKGKHYGDQTVELMKKRLDELQADYLKLREDNTSKANMEDLIDQLSKSQKDPTHNPPVEPEKPTITLKDVEEAAMKKYQEIDMAKQQQANYLTVVNKLKEKFGTNYTNSYKQQIEELGLSDAYATELAKNHPQVLIKTLGLDQQTAQEQYTSPPRSSQRSDSFAPSGTKERTWSYWQELKKKDYAAYLDRKNQIQMQEDMIRLGDKFKDGDFRMYGD